MCSTVKENQCCCQSHESKHECFDHFYSVCLKLAQHERNWNAEKKLAWLIWYLFDRASLIDCVWSAMAHAQKPDFVFRRNGRVHLHREGRQFSRLLAAEVCASAVVMLGTTSSDVVWRALATHSIRQFRLHFPSRVSPCAITFQLDSTNNVDNQLDATITVYY